MWGIYILIFGYIVMFNLAVISAFLIDRYFIKKLFNKTESIWSRILRIIIGIIVLCTILIILQVAFSLVLIPKI